MYCEYNNMVLELVATSKQVLSNKCCRTSVAKMRTIRFLFTSTNIESPNDDLQSKLIMTNVMIVMNIMHITTAEIMVL